MRRILILAEGQTEEQFVKRVLGPHLEASDLAVTPIIAKTKRVKAGGGFKGGVVSFRQVSRELRRLLGDTDAACITTLIDYYGLPHDFPGMATRGALPTPRERVEHVENTLAAEFSDKRFIPHLILHEFETLIFSDLDACAWVFDGDASQLKAVRNTFPTPEDINEGPQTDPSKRILACCPTYDKALHGPAAVLEIGLQRARGQCPHFDAWLTALEGL